MTLPAIDVGIEPRRRLVVTAETRSLGRLVHEVAFRAGEGEHYFESPLGYGSFFSGQSDYEVPSDELYCPCGVTLDWFDRNLGTAVELVDEHVVEAHPDATAKARAKRLRDRAR